jgi:hypothetical protein
MITARIDPEPKSKVETIKSKAVKKAEEIYEKIIKKDIIGEMKHYLKLKIVRYDF